MVYLVNATYVKVVRKSVLWEYGRTMQTERPTDGRTDRRDEASGPSFALVLQAHLRSQICTSGDHIKMDMGNVM